MSRNVNVQVAVDAALAAVDESIGGARVRLPSAAFRRVCEEQLGKANSVRVASLFLAHYALVDGDWDFDHVPVGARGVFGDKRLSEQLTLRHLTLHDNITAFGENLGWKGNVSNVRLSADPKFSAFCNALKTADGGQRKRMAAFLASRFAESRQEMRPLPPVGADVLTFAKAKALLDGLMVLHTEGFVQQFLVAALLTVHRRRFGNVIRTHNPHAADTFDETAGDVEEFRDDSLVMAYEVTVRTDWKNRVSNFRRKMDLAGLKKYVIFAAGVNEDDELRVPARLIAFLEPHQRDIAVVDLWEFLVVMAAELTADELRQAVNCCYDLLCQHHLGGRPAFQLAFREAVDAWLDGVSPSGVVD